MKLNLLHYLVYTSLTSVKSQWINEVNKIFRETTEKDWQATYLELERHRLTPLVFFSLKKWELFKEVPSHYSQQMQASYRQTRIKNVILLSMLGNILEKMQQYGMNPVLWKGVVLADSFYPDLGTRPMGDIDFSIPPDEKDIVIEVFQYLGFHPLTEESGGILSGDGINFSNDNGIICDVHHRVRLFEGKEQLNLTTSFKPQHINTSALPVLEPNAMLVHLIVHLDSHRKEEGLTLFWILDIAFVLRKWGSLLKMERLEQLMPSHEHFISLFRILAFLEQEFGETIPACFTQEVKSVEPLTLEEILRQRRLASWGLPSPKGWMRFIASPIWEQIRDGDARPPLSISDLLLCYADILKNRKMGLMINKKYQY